MLAGLAALPFAVNAAEEAPPGEFSRALIGSWFVTSGPMSIVFSLEPNGQALVLFDDNGAFTIGRHLWRALPGGALIETLPRFRIWPSPGPCDARVEMEDLHADVEVSEGFRHFPLRFCMKRVTHAPLPKQLLERPVTKGWESETVDSDWDKKAGERR